MTSLTTDTPRHIAPRDVALWNRVARSYAARPVGNIPAYERTLERTRAHLRPEDRVLELGCGTGTTALKLADAVASYTGTDVSSEMIAIAREKLAVSGPSTLGFRVAEARGNAADGDYDAVLAFNLMPLIPETEAAIRDLRARLRPGGLFISKSTCIGRCSPLRPFIVVMQLIGKAPPVRYMTVQEYDRMIEAAGFEILETGGLPKKANRFVVARRLD